MLTGTVEQKEEGYSSIGWQLLPKVGCTTNSHRRTRKCNFLKLSFHVFTASPSDPGTVYEKKYVLTGSTQRVLWEVCIRPLRRRKPVFLNRDWRASLVGWSKSMIGCCDWWVPSAGRKCVLKHPNLRARRWQSLAGSKNINNSLT